MKFSEAWLRELVKVDDDTAGLVRRLTMAGLEVDAVEPVGDFSGVIVARVQSVNAHPSAEKLKLCRVDAGQGELIQVVCGAANVVEGMRTPLATIGASLPGGARIDQTTLKGEPSFGMLCSAAELGLSDDTAGLMELPAEAPVGADLRDYLNLEDTVIDVDLTPNRADCLSISGLAREVATLYGTVCTLPQTNNIASTHDGELPVQLSADAACPHYASRVIVGVDINRPSPLWLREKLRRSGLRSIDPVVDVTNYVMLETGQPLHAFDLDTLSGGIEVRYAKDGESLTLLGGEVVELDRETLVIADNRGPLAMAGVMGGAESAVSGQTKNLFIESAHFAPVALAGTARRYGLHTDASHRFERGVDPTLPAVALERATELLMAIVGGNPGEVRIAETDGFVVPRREITLRRSRISQQLGIALESEMVTDLLRRLNIAILETTQESWLCVAPAWRFDLAIEADLIEEVARVYGYENLPVNRVGIELLQHGPREAETPLGRIKDLLVARGYSEAITYSFVDAGLQDKVNPGVPAIPVANPISHDMSVMRTSLVPGLLQTLVHNINRQQSRVRLFETGLRFIAGKPLRQENMLAAVITGTRYAENWANSREKVDFFDIKGDLEAVLSLTGASARCATASKEHAGLQPGQSAAIVDDADRVVGYMGKLHPVLGKGLGINQSVYWFEIELAAIITGHIPEFRETTKFPGTRRDLAFFVDAAVTYRELSHIVETHAGENLHDLKVFDIYNAKHVENNRKSLGIGLTFQDNSRTLTDEEVNSAVNEVVVALKENFSAELRG